MLSEEYRHQSPGDTGQWTSRSQTVSNLRKLTGETILLNPEDDVEDDRSQIAGKSLALAVPLFGLSVFAVLVTQQINYARQTEQAVQEGTTAQVVAAIDQGSSKKKVVPVIEFPKQSVSTSTPATESRQGSFSHVNAPADQSSPPPAFSSETDKQIYLSDQLASHGAFDSSASALAGALVSHSKDTKLRVEAIRAEMRIKAYSSARKLCKEGVNLAVSKTDRDMFVHMLNDIPSS